MYVASPCTAAQQNGKTWVLKESIFRFWVFPVIWVFRFLNFIFCKALLGVACVSAGSMLEIELRQLHILIADLVKLT